MNIKIPYEQIIKTLEEKSDLSATEIEGKIDAKLKQLSGLISKEGAAHIVANELGVKLLEQTTGKLKVKDILAGMRNIEVIGKAAQVYEVREFQTGQRSGKVGSFILADETGKIRVVCWGTQADRMKEMAQGDVIGIKSAYVKDNNAQLEIHLNDMASLALNPPGVEVNVDISTVSAQSDRPAATRKKISELTGDAENIEIMGHVVQVFDPKYYEVCPTCGKRAKNEGEGCMCPEHGKVEPDWAYLVNLFLDDGTENIRVVCFRNQAERLLGKNKADMLTYRESPEEFASIKNNILGNPVMLRGRVSKNEMFDRIEFIAQFVDADHDPKKELENVES